MTIHYQKVLRYLSCIFCLWLSLGSSLGSDQVLAEEIDQLYLTNQDNLAHRLLERGIKLYEQRSFDSAKNFWLKSASFYAQQKDILGEALALNNLATAHQQLEEWKLAEEAVTRSFYLLQDRTTLSKIPGYWEVLAKAHNTQGNNLLNTGKTQLALKSWQDASQFYLRAQNNSGVIISQINQAKALQNLGFSLKALGILKKLEVNLQQESNSQLQVVGLRHLGISLRNFGNLEKSAKTLKQSISLAKPSQSDSLSWLELGNTQRKQGDRANEIGKGTQAHEYFAQAMKSYQLAAQNKSLSLIAELNQLSLLVDLGRYEEAEVFLAEFQFPTQLKSSRDSVYALLNYARSLTCLRASGNITPLCKPQAEKKDTYNARFDEIITIIEQGITQAREIEDPIAEAQAIRQLAEIYELQSKYQLAQDLTQQALLLIEGKSIAEITYLLEWQLGRIYRKQRNISAATTAYSQAISSLEKARANILFIDPNLQFSFRDQVEPVYREYADLLLTTTKDNQLPSQNNLKQAIKAINALQIAELENFLGCDLSQQVKLDETTVDTNAAQIYPIILSNRLVSIIDIPGYPLTFQETKISRSQVAKTVNSLQINLSQPGKTPEVLAQGQQIYQWLIKPLESILAAHSSIETLVFIPDSILRNIPFSVLYDGEAYLIEKGYAIAVNPKLELFAPAVSGKPLKVLTGGVEISQTIEGFDFSAIAQVEEELTNIAGIVNTNQPLLNQDFTESNIKQKLEQADFSAIHWKTHGVFSSEPTATFLVAYQDSIKANQLQSIVQTASKRGQKPLELLVLSACETAKGDNRAILGLAGLTVRTGARTALSTIWRAEDRATTLLMTEFYQQLSSGSNKAEALRQAQLSLMQQEGYLAPYYWGTYLLVGNWL
ncbi:MAG: CHAT domain-containing protein [Cyanobacteria bacterium P01_A01_bin.40]